MDAVDREELMGLLAEALMRDSAFRLRRRHWPPTRIDAGSRPRHARPASSSISTLRYPLFTYPARAAA